jgi:membrane protein DedA with SNARE-associated domain
VGALALHAIARFGGRSAVLRLRRVLRVDEDDLDRAESWFDRGGVLVGVFGRMIRGRFAPVAQRPWSNPRR